MTAMSQKRWNQIDKQKTVIANQMQLNQSNTQLHEPGHLKASIEQNAGMLSSVNAKAHNADKWQADPKYNLLLAKNPALACYVWCNLSLPVFTFSLGVASTVAQCHLCATC
jgi:hypothetical protein